MTGKPRTVAEIDKELGITRDTTAEDAWSSLQGTHTEHPTHTQEEWEQYAKEQEERERRAAELLPEYEIDAGEISFKSPPGAHILRPDGMRIPKHSYAPSIGLPDQVCSNESTITMLDALTIEEDLEKMASQITRGEDLAKTYGYRLASVRGIPVLLTYGQATGTDGKPLFNKDGEPVIRANYSHKLSRALCTQVQTDLQRLAFFHYKKLHKFAFETVERICELVACRNPVNPILEIARTTRWDGVQRVSSLFQRFGYHAPKVGLTPEQEENYLTFCSEAVILGMMERQIHPVRVDFMAMLIDSKQGVGKSRLVEFLANGFYGEAGELGKNTDENALRDFMHKGLGKAILEMSESRQFTLENIELLKSILSKKTYTAVDKFEKNPKDYDVGFIFIGTTNNAQIFKDPSGNRRFLPMEPGEDSLERLETVLNTEPAFMDQVYAEALEIVEEALENGCTEGVFRRFYTDEVRQSQEMVCEANLSLPRYVAELAEYIKVELLKGPMDNYLDNFAECTMIEERFARDYGGVIDRRAFDIAAGYLRKYPARFKLRVGQRTINKMRPRCYMLSE